MLEIHSTDDLARMFSLYSNIPESLPPIASIVKSHIIDLGNKFLNQAKGEQKANAQQSRKQYVENLMKTHEQYLDLVTTCFKANAIFHKALKEAFETIVNQKIGRCTTAEMLADYADLVLKKGGLRLTEIKLQETLDNIVRLFTYLSDKDMFSEFYRKQLSKRLLLRRSASDEDEKNMIGKLKMRCGAQFTSKLEGMINDIRSGDEHQVAFQDHLREKDVNLGVDFSVTILTTGFWPTYQKEEMKLPQKMTKCLETFGEYYLSKTQNRQISWIHQLGSVTLTGHFDRRRIDLEVSTLQAAILLLFNEKKIWVIQDMINRLGITPDQAKANLRSLVSGKFKILQKNPSEGYRVTHQMRVNRRFQSQLRRIRVPNAIMRTSNKERKQANESIQEERKYVLEAYIVRVMKSRKTLSHAQLVQEVTKQVLKLFTPNPRHIKQRIGDLISRDYLTRDPEQSNVYHYVA